MAKKFRLNDLLNIGKLDFFTFGFFKIRALIYMTFLGFLTQDIKVTMAVFIIFIWVQFEFLYMTIDLDDKHVSDWEMKLGKKIKGGKGKHG